MQDAAKEILFSDEARLKLKEGIDHIAEVVCPTFGPKGMSVAIDERFSYPKITNSGKSILNDFSVKDPLVDMGVSLARQACMKIKEKTGDGTTTCMILLQAMVKEGVKLISSGHSPVFISRGLEKGVKVVLKEINANSRQIETHDEIEKIAKLSASGDGEIGALIADAFEKVGKEGLISIEEAKGYESYIEVTEGIQIEKGYLSSSFVNNHEKMIVEMNHPKVLIYDQKIHSIQDIMSLLQKFVKTEEELIIIAEDIDPNVLSTLIMNYQKNLIKVCAIKAPGLGDERKKRLEDLAISLGTSVISNEIGINLKDIEPEHLGSCKKAIISKNKTVLIEGNGSQKFISDRIEQLNKAISKQKDPFQKKILEKRKSNLECKVGKIHIGAYTEPDLLLKKELCENSLESTKVALLDGVCVGGGITYLQAIKALSAIELDKEEMIGINILQTALRAPVTKLILNAGYSPALILDEISRMGRNFGFNVLSEEVENLLEEKVIDATKVIKSSLIHAASVARIIFLTETLIC